MVVVHQGSRLIYRLLVRAQVAAWNRRTNIVPGDAPVFSLNSSSSVLGSGSVSHDGRLLLDERTFYKDKKLKISFH